MPDLAVAALAHAALHMALEAHVDMVVADALLPHLVDGEPIHHRRPAQGAERVGGIDLQMLERLCDQADLAVPRVVGMIHRQVQVEVLAMAPHLELLAEHHLGGVLRTVDDGDLAELGTLVVDVVDERAQRSDAEAARHQQDVVPLHVLEREASAERAAQAHDVAALHLVQHLGEVAGATHAQLDEAALGRRAGYGDRRLAHPEDGHLDELARLVRERIADALVDQTKLEQLLRLGEVDDGRDPRRPRPIRVRRHHLLARQGSRLVEERFDLDGGHRAATGHLASPSSRRTRAPRWG